MEARGISHIYVGLFSILGAIALFYLSIRTDADESVADGRPIMVRFVEARGLLVGANVTYHGVRVGLVDDIRLIEEEGVLQAEVRLMVQKSARVYKDVAISVSAATLLGTMEVTLTGGTPGSPEVTEGDLLQGKSSVNIEEAVAKLTEGIESVKKLANNLDANQADMFQTIKSVLEDNREKINNAIDSFAKAGPKFDEITANINEVSAKLANGEGTLGKLIADPEMFEKFDKISTDISAITDQIAKGEGTMGKLVFSEEGLTDLKKSLEDISTAFDEIKAVLDENREEISKAVKGLSDVGPALQEAAANIKTISARIEDGTGTLGKLVNDPGLYDEAKGAAAQLRETLEEAEEQTVLQSFFRIFTGGI